MKSLFLVATMSLASCGAAVAQDVGLRIIQLDLARQPETTTFISNYIDHVSSWGYNALELYLEGRVSTKTFTIANARGYSVDEMKGVVAHASEKGMTVVPVVSFLAHAEHFFRDESRMGMCETREGTFRVPFIHDTFCYSQPETIAFIEKYAADLCEVFTGPYFHVGFDEAWNSGVCSKCSKIDGDALLQKQIETVHAILAKHGKRMWMWDDFFEFHRATLFKLPRDVVMMHWNYAKDISDRGARAFLPGSLRRNSLAEYASLGFDAIPCSWYPCENIRSFVAYARRNRTMGYLQTQWEDLIANFHGGTLPRVLAVSKILDDPALDRADDAFLRAVHQLAPSLTETEAAAAVRLMTDPADELALRVLSDSSCADQEKPVAEDPFSERAIVDELVCRSQMAVMEAKVAKAETILADPRRDASDLDSVRKLLSSIPESAERLANRRKAQCDAWRAGREPWCVTKPPSNLGKRAKSLSDGAALALPNEKRLEIEFSRIDRWVRPTWRVEGEFDGLWREIATFTLLHGEDRRADFTYGRTFSAASLPVKLRLAHKGFGDCQVRFVSVSDRNSRCIPLRLVESEGDVRDPDKILVDDYSAATFGRSGFLTQFNDKAEAERFSTVVLAMQKGCH